MGGGDTELRQMAAQRGDRPGAPGTPEDCASGTACRSFVYTVTKRMIGHGGTSRNVYASDAFSSHGLTQEQGLALSGESGVGSPTLKRFFAAGEVVIFKTWWMIRDHQSGG